MGVRPLAPLGPQDPVRDRPLSHRGWSIAAGWLSGGRHGIGPRCPAVWETEPLGSGAGLVPGRAAGHCGARLGAVAAWLPAGSEASRPAECGLERVRRPAV